MAIQKAEAFVLRSQPFRTSSLLVTTFTRPFGKIKGIAKGVVREGVARPSTFEPFSLLEIVFYEKLRSDLHLISEASILESYLPLRSNLESLATAYYLAELVDQLTEPHDPHDGIFELLQCSFQWLTSLSPFRVARFFEIRLLSEIGLLPYLGGCLSCEKENPEKVYFSVRQGAIFCFDCRKKYPDARPISLSTLGRMRSFLSKDASKIIQGSGAEKDDGEIADIMARFLSDRLGKRLSTQRFLNQVRGLLVRKA